MTDPNSLNYNERSWGIDLISEINLYCANRNKSIKRAGGEHTLSVGQGRLFPDVLLFGDDHGSVVLQGWELKMPDTPISDIDLIQNAKKKALRLKLNSFLLWNVKEAILYIQDQDKNYVPKKNWYVSAIKTRKDVVLYRQAWKTLLYQLINELNDFLLSGDIFKTKPEIAINDMLYADFLTNFRDIQSNFIKTSCVKDAEFEALIDVWFNEHEFEYKPLNRYQAISNVNIINWINRFIFAHYLKKVNDNAQLVDSINSQTSVSEAISLFEKITKSCDFMNIFKPSLGQEYLCSSLWQALLELNQFLIDFNLCNISQVSFQKILDTALVYSRKKLAGQFSTPSLLADFLVGITVKDRTKPVIDPCCGTGTIARSIFQLKRAKQLGVKDALKTTWASDKFAFPLQLCSMALSDPDGMGEVVQTFQKDALFLSIDEKIEFIEPFDGRCVARNLPKMHAIVSNLPFVRFEDVFKLNPNIEEARQAIINLYGDAPDKRADLYVYLILKLKKLLEKKGRMGIIISNAWLGADWGQEFRSLLLKHFSILKVIISGQGRWFCNAHVVTSIIVLEAKEKETNCKHSEIAFFTTLKTLHDWDQNTLNSLIRQVLISQSKKDLVYVQVQKNDDIAYYELLGIGWNALFSDLSWIKTIRKFLIPVHDCFDVKRGERRGWDEFFYPCGRHNIEDSFIKPVLKSSRNLDGKLIAVVNDEAFCCAESILDLELKQQNGALNWIRRFQYVKNGQGKCLEEVLSKTNMHWYQMDSSTLADIVLSMNPDKKLCFYRLKERSFVNQRLIRFTIKDTGMDVSLCHALLNSIVGMFLLEAIGFGRGLGALDINATKISKGLHMLDPRYLEPQTKQKIKEAFELLLARKAKNLPNELQDKDRIYFDEIVLDAYGLRHLRKLIYDALLKLYHIRQTAREPMLYRTA